MKSYDNLQLLSWWFFYFLSLNPQPSFCQSLSTIDSLVHEQMKSRQTPGLTLAIIQNDSLIFKKAYGVSSIEHQVPVKVETVFELASLSKQFITSAILLLEQDGRLKLSDPINLYLDSLPSKWQNLTFNQLLTHTAGLPSMEMELQSLKTNGWPKYVSRTMLWESALKDPITAKPGTKFSYHNVGYSLALLALEAITENDHRLFFQNRLFQPLGMNNTFFEDLDKIVPNLSKTYTLKNGQLVPNRRVGQEEIGVGDGIYSTIDDLIKWNYSINNNLTLDSMFTQKLFTRVKLNNGEDFRYGLGWWIPNRNGRLYYYHNGVTGTEYLKVPWLGLDIITLGNLGQGSFDHVSYWGLAHAIAGFMFPEFNHHPEPKPIDLKTLRGMEGNFYYESGGDLEIYLKGSELFLKDEYGEFKMIYIDNNVFTLLDDPIRLEFLTPNQIKVVDEIWNDDMAYRKE